MDQERLDDEVPHVLHQDEGACRERWLIVGQPMQHALMLGTEHRESASLNFSEHAHHMRDIVHPWRSLAQRSPRERTVQSAAIEDDVLFRREVAKERAPPDAGGRGDLVDGRRGEPLAAEEPHRCVDDGLLGAGLIARAQTNHVRSRPGD